MDARRRIPATDRILHDPQVADAVDRLGREPVKTIVHSAQERARLGRIEPDAVLDATLAALPAATTGLRRVRNATGVLLHTNLGRAALSDAALEAIGAAAGTSDVELDLDSGRRGPRGRATTSALTEAVPAAEAAHVVNNGAAALALAATALSALG